MFLNTLAIIDTNFPSVCEGELVLRTKLSQGGEYDEDIRTILTRGSNHEIRRRLKETKEERKELTKLNQAKPTDILQLEIDGEENAKVKLPQQYINQIEGRDTTQTLVQDTFNILEKTYELEFDVCKPYQMESSSDHIWPLFLTHKRHVASYDLTQTVSEQNKTKLLYRMTQNYPIWKLTMVGSMQNYYFILLK